MKKNKNNFRIRRATLNDLDVLARHRRLMFVDMDFFTEKEARSGDKAYKKWVTEKFRAKKFLGFLLENDSREVVAGGCLWFREAQPRPLRKQMETPYLLSVYTEKGHRGSGLASRITKEAVKAAKKRGFTRVELHASKQGKGVYKKLGFTPTNEMRYGK